MYGGCLPCCWIRVAAIGDEADDVVGVGGNVLVNMILGNHVHALKLLLYGMYLPLLEGLTSI